MGSGGGGVGSIGFFQKERHSRLRGDDEHFETSSRLDPPPFQL